MIKFYSYSSYKYSPVGFNLGYIELSDSEHAGLTELTICSDDFIRSCFENGLIQSVYGQHINNQNYILIIKKLTTNFINEDGLTSEKICSFAFEFSSEQDYLKFKANFNEDKLKEAINEVIIPDSSAKNFALKINCDNLNAYITSVINGSNTPIDNECSYLYLKAISAQTDYSQKFTEIFNYPILRETNYLYTTKKKKNSNKENWHYSPDSTIHNTFADIIPDELKTVAKKAKTKLRDKFYKNL